MESDYSAEEADKATTWDKAHTRVLTSCHLDYMAGFLGVQLCFSVLGWTPEGYRWSFLVPLIFLRY